MYSKSITFFIFIDFNVKTTLLKDTLKIYGKLKSLISS